MSKQTLRGFVIVACLATFGTAYAADPTAPEGQTPSTPPTTSATSPTTPPQQPATVQPAAQPTGEDQDKVVCKKMDPPTGSRMGAKKVCKTVAEWRREQEASKEVIDDVQNKSGTWNPPGG